MEPEPRIKSFAEGGHVGVGNGDCAIDRGIGDKDVQLDATRLVAVRMA